MSSECCVEYSESILGGPKSVPTARFFRYRDLFSPYRSFFSPIGNAFFPIGTAVIPIGILSHYLPFWQIPIGTERYL